MTEEELKALQAELEKQKAEQEAKATEQAEKQKKLEEQENALNEKANKLANDEADTSKVAEKIKQSFEKRLEEQKATYEKRLETRDNMIKQLSEGKSTEPHPSAFDELNEKREKQLKANYGRLFK